MENPSQSYGTSPAIGNHTVLDVTRHRWTCSALPQPDTPVLDLPTLERWKVELILVLVSLYSEMVYLHVSANSHPSN